jgi:hypothetical protein
MAFEPDIPILAVLVAAAAGFLVGGLWYSPLLFGRPWARIMGMSMDEKPPRRVMVRAYLISAIAMLLMVYVLAHIMEASFTAGEDRTYANAAMGAFWVWLGFVATVHAGRVAWGKGGWPLFAIDAGHYLVVLQLAAAVLYFWPV